MIFNWEVSVGDIIAICALLGSVIMLIVIVIKQREAKYFAQNANAYNDSAKKYYDLMHDEIKDKKYNPAVDNTGKITTKANCDASIVRLGSNQWILRVFNKGNANATNVSFRYLIDHAPSIAGVHDQMISIELLEPQKNVDYHLGAYLSLSSSSWEYEITWTNEDGTQDSKKGVLTLPLS